MFRGNCKFWWSGLHGGKSEAESSKEAESDHMIGF